MSLKIVRTLVEEPKHLCHRFAGHVLRLTFTGSTASRSTEFKHGAKLLTPSSRAGSSVFLVTPNRFPFLDLDLQARTRSHLDVVVNQAIV